MRRGQYSILWFISIVFVLLSLVGVVSDRLVDNTEQVSKAQEILKVSDLVNAIKTIQKQERQVGIDYAGIHLGSIGLFPHGTSPCGVSINLSNYKLDKYVPYWKTAKETEEYYYYVGSRFNKAPGDNWIAFKFENVRQGDYVLEIREGSSKHYDIGWFLIDGKPQSNYENGSPYDIPENTSPFSLVGGNHLVVLSNDLCKHTISDTLSFCEDPEFKTKFDISSFYSDNPPQIVLQRVINEKNQICIPDPLFVKDTFESFINELFYKIDGLAYNAIINTPKTLGLENQVKKLVFPKLTYKAVVEDNLSTPDVVEGFAENAMYVNFYPTLAPIFTLQFKSELANITYTGTTYVFDAFDSDFAKFRGAAVKLVRDSELESLVNAMLDNHSWFEIAVKFNIEGSPNPNYENYLNTYYNGRYNLNSFDLQSASDFTNIFGADFIFKPMCVYLFREVCQFFSDDKYLNYESDKEFDSTELYDSLTKPLWNDTGVPGTSITEDTDAWSSLKENCRLCHALPYKSNPCLNFTYEPCLKCFETFFSNYMDVHAESDLQKSFNTYALAFDNATNPNPVTIDGTTYTYESAGAPPTCKDAVYDSIIPMLTELLKSRFPTITEWLNEKYPDIKWWVDMDRVNITDIFFKGIDKEGSYFNSSCRNCENSEYMSNCKPFVNDLKADELELSNYLERHVGPSGKTFIYNIDAEGSPNPANAIKVSSFKISNVQGSNANNSKLIVDFLFDFKRDNPLNYKPDSYEDENYYNFNDIFDTNYKGGVLAYTGAYITWSTSQDLLLDGDEPVYPLPDEVELPSPYALFQKAEDLGIYSDYKIFLKDRHMLYVCVRSEYDDDTDYSNNCQAVGVEFCADGDVSQACCEAMYGGTWLLPKRMTGYDFVSGFEVSNKDNIGFPDGRYASIKDINPDSHTERMGCDYRGARYQSYLKIDLSSYDKIDSIKIYGWSNKDFRSRKYCISAMLYYSGGCDYWWPEDSDPGTSKNWFDLKLSSNNKKPKALYIGVTCSDVYLNIDAIKINGEFLEKGINEPVCCGDDIEYKPDIRYLNATGNLDAKDYTNDGLPDLSIGNTIYASNGDRTFMEDGNAPQKTYDFNNDGHPDLFKSHSYGLEISLSNQDGSYVEADEYTLSSAKTDVVTADLNNDGYLDIATSGVEVLLNKGDGTFDNLQKYDAAGTKIVIYDFNNDGYLDIATQEDILFNNGDGTFASPIRYNTLTNKYYGITAGDFNNDGNGDIAVVDQTCRGSYRSHYERLLIFFGDGNGAFTNNKINLYTYPYCQSQPRAYDVVSGDFDSDGDLDLAVAHSSKLIILLNKGDGTFEKKIYGSRYSKDLIPYDVDNDGDLDLLSREGVGEYYESSDRRAPFLRVFSNDGNGAFTDTLDLYFPFTWWGADFVLTDFNNDGIMDIAVSSSKYDSEPAIYFLEGDGLGSFSFKLTRGIYDKKNSYLASGDLNNDGKDELIVVKDDLKIFTDAFLDKNPVYNVFRRLYDSVTEEGSSILNHGILDINNDGFLDAYVVIGRVYSLYRMIVFFNDGTGLLNEGKMINFDGKIHGWVFSDFNNDLLVDIVVSSNGKLHILINNGQNDFTKTSYDYGSWENLIAADFNNDGYMDFAGSNKNVVGTFINKGNAEFEKGASYETRIYDETNSYWYNDKISNLAVGNFDDDGLPDLVAISYHTRIFNTTLDISEPLGIGALNILYNRLGSFIYKPYYFDEKIHYVVVGDFDANNYDDIAFDTGSQTAVLFNDKFENPFDDSYPYDDDSFMIDKNLFCYDGKMHLCDPEKGTYVAGKIRTQYYARDYTVPKFDFYCTGE